MTEWHVSGRSAAPTNENAPPEGVDDPATDAPLTVSLPDFAGLLEEVGCIIKGAASSHAPCWRLAARDAPDHCTHAFRKACQTPCSVRQQHARLQFRASLSCAR